MVQVFSVGNLQSQITVHKNQSHRIPLPALLWIVKDHAHVENTRGRDKV